VTTGPAGAGGLAIPYARGQVLGPDGKPPAGASVHVVYPGPTITGSFTTDGTFSVAVGKLAPRTGAMNGPLGVVPFNPAGVAVVADGLGFGWADGAAFADGREPVVRLVEDQVVSGRVLGPDGRPLAGAAVRVEEVRAYPGVGARAALKELPPTGKDRPAAVTWTGLLPADAGTAVTTRDGRFRLTRLGRDRLVRLRIEGRGTAPAAVSVVTLEPKAGDPPLPARDEADRPLFGSDLEFRLPAPGGPK
jgi:hypothetical protein